MFASQVLGSNLACYLFHYCDCVKWLLSNGVFTHVIGAAITITMQEMVHAIVIAPFEIFCE